MLKISRAFGASHAGVDVSTHIEGLAELHAQLRELKAKASGQILRFATRKAAQPIVQRAQATVPVGSVNHKTYKGNMVTPGFLSRSIRIKSFVFRKKNVARAFVGVVKEAYYGLVFLELGTSKMEKQEWLVPAFNSTKDVVLERLKIELRKGIDRAVKKRAKAAAARAG